MYKIITLLLLLFALSSADTYLADDFSDGNADGWFEFPTGANYEVVDSVYRMSYSGTEFIDALTWWDTPMPVADYTAMIDFTANSPTSNVGINVRLEPDTLLSNINSYAAYAQYTNGGWLFIAKYAPYELLASISYPFAYGVDYSMKICVQGNAIMAKAWVKGTAEPGWLLATTDSDLCGPGHVALEGYNHPSGSYRFDVYSVLVADPVQLEQTTWGEIKATF